MINYNSTTKLIFSKGQNISDVKLKPKSSVGVSDSEFKNVFDKTLNNSAKRTYSDNGSHDDNKVAQSSSDKYKSFRDVKNAKVVNSSKDSVGKTSGDIKSKTLDEESQKLTDKSDKYDETINVLAQMLGLQPSELVKLANDAGFSAEDLKDPNNMAIFVDKLAGVMQLNDSQKAMLNALASEVLKQANAAQGNEVKSASEGTDTVDVKDQADSATDAKNVDLSKIADEVKEKLDQLIQKASTGTESLSSEISKVIEQMRSQIQAKVTAVAEQTEDIQNTTDNSEEVVMNPGQTSVEKKVTEKETTAALDSKKDAKAEHAENKGNSAAAVVNATDVQVSTGNDQSQDLNQQNPQAIADLKVVLSNNQTEVQKTDFTMPQPVKSAEVVNQVVEQAKVIIGQDKSEMVIQLKPDHLGKLELKVVTEQGIVAAKFIAESHQVKEIIETNMQLLKDSLQKQGISVESVSVQVGNGSENQKQNSYESRNSSNNGHRYGNSNSEAGVVQVSANAVDTLPERFAQYSDETSTVNYTA